MENNTNEVLCLSNTDEFRKKLISRINRIAGQLRGIEKIGTQVILFGFVV